MADKGKANPPRKPKDSEGQAPPGRGDGKYIHALFWKKGCRG